MFEICYFNNESSFKNLMPEVENNKEKEHTSKLFNVFKTVKKTRPNLVTIKDKKILN